MSTNAFDLAVSASQQRTATDFFRELEFKVYIWPDLWRGLAAPEDFNWTEVPFDQASIAQIPPNKGIYAFKIDIGNTILPNNSVIVYIGQSGVRGNGSLQRRFKEYLYYKRRGGKREKFNWLFKNWPDDLTFCFSALDCTNAELAKLENDLSDAIIPVCSKMDFSAHVRRVIVPALRK